MTVCLPFFHIQLQQIFYGAIVNITYTLYSIHYTHVVTLGGASIYIFAVVCHLLDNQTFYSCTDPNTHIRYTIYLSISALSMSSVRLSASVQCTFCRTKIFLCVCADLGKKAVEATRVNVVILVSKIHTSGVTFCYSVGNIAFYIFKYTHHQATPFPTQ